MSFVFYIYCEQRENELENQYCICLPLLLCLLVDNTFRDML